MARPNFVQKNHGDLTGAHFTREGREYVVVQRLPRNMVLVFMAADPEPAAVLIMALPKGAEISPSTPVDEVELKEAPPWF